MQITGYDAITWPATIFVSIAPRRSLSFVIFAMVLYLAAALVRGYVHNCAHFHERQVSTSVRSYARSESLPFFETVN